MLSKLNPHLRNTVYYGIAMFLPRALIFLLLPVFTRWLPPAEFGTFMLLNACLNGMRLFMALGFVPALIWSLNYKKTPGRETLATAMIFLFAVGAVWGTAIAIAAPWICNDLAAGAFPPGLFRIVVLTAFIESCELISVTYFRSRGEAGRFAILGVLRFIIEGALRVIFLVALERGVGGLIESGLVSSCLLCLITMCFLRGHFTPAFSWPVLRGLLRFGLPLVPVQLAIMTMDVADRYILNHFATSREVGIYSLGYNIGMAVNFITQTVTLVWVPLMYKLAKRPDASALFGHLTTLYGAFLALACLGLAAFGGDIVRIMASPAYATAAVIVPVIVVAYAFQGLSQFINVGVNTRNLTHISAIIAVTFAALNIALNFILIPRHGMIGAMWTSFITTTAMSITMMIVNQRLFPIRYEYARLAAAAALAAALAFAAIQTDALPPALHIPAKLVLIALYPALLFLLRIFTRDDITGIRRLMR